MIETITFKDTKYPKFQSEHFAAQFVFPFADKILKGIGFDIGYGEPEWILPDNAKRSVIGIEKDRYLEWKSEKADELIATMRTEETKFDACFLPVFDDPIDFIFSSHCLEHIAAPPFEVLNYWYTRLATEGILFLYLPDFSQKYWRPWHNSKHKHVITRKIIKTYLNESGKWTNVFVSGVDLNNSFVAIAEKVQMDSYATGKTCKQLTTIKTNSSNVAGNND